MIVESIKLNNFRNYNNLELKFDKGTNLFYGDNAQERQIYWKLSICAERHVPIKAARTGS